MALWEIRQLDQTPLRIEVDDSRNLAQEFHEAVLRWQSRAWWKFWNRATPYWQITPQHELPLGVVAGVFIVKKRQEPADPVIGFRTT